MKIAFGMIVFEGDYVLQQCLEQVYPYAEQILIAEGPVKYWQDKGRTTSTDTTNDILKNFPDPDNKIKIVHGQWSEKDEQCKAYMKHVNDDIDYIWNLDSDEVYKSKDIESIIKILKEYKPTSVGVQSCSFYGGFTNYLTGFELAKDNFLRIFKYEKGSTWLTHRPPTIKYKTDVTKRHINSDQLYALTDGAQMYHYSYVFPRQVKTKIGYYKAKVSMNKCIDNYYENVYLPWVNGKKSEVEFEYKGVHEFKPEYRGACYTAPFEGTHPKTIERDMRNLKNTNKIISEKNI
jgi:hypothetical protein